MVIILAEIVGIKLEVGRVSALLKGDFKHFCDTTEGVSTAVWVIRAIRDKVKRERS